MSFLGNIGHLLGFKNGGHGFGHHDHNHDLRHIHDDIILNQIFGSITLEKFDDLRRYYDTMNQLRTVIDSKVRDGASGIVTVNDKPVEDSILSEPNGQTTFQEWFIKVLTEIEIYGGVIIVNQGIPSRPSLDIFSFGRTKIKLNEDSNEFLPNYIKEIRYETTTKQIIVLTEQDRDKYFIFNRASVNNITPVSNINTLRPSLDLLRTIEKASDNILRKRGMFGMLTRASGDPNSLTGMNEKELRDELQRVTRNYGIVDDHQSPIGVSKTPLNYLSMNVDFTSLEIPAKKKEAFEEIVKTYGLDTSLFTDPTFMNKEAARLNVFSTTIIPETKQLFDSLSKFLNVEIKVNYSMVPSIAKAISAMKESKQLQVNQMFENIELGKQIGLNVSDLEEQVQLTIEQDNQ